MTPRPVRCPACGAERETTEIRPVCPCGGLQITQRRFRTQATAWELPETAEQFAALSNGRLYAVLHRWREKRLGAGGKQLAADKRWRERLLDEFERRGLHDYQVAALRPEPCACGKPGTRVVGATTYCEDCVKVSATAQAVLTKGIALVDRRGAFFGDIVDDREDQDTLKQVLRHHPKGPGHRRVTATYIGLRRRK
jgi:hypothetical protein